MRRSNRGTLAELEANRWLDCQPPFEELHFLNGFGHADGKFHFRADWANAPYAHDGLKGPWEGLPTLPDHWPVNEAEDDEHPFKLATSPARNFLNSSFTQTPTSRSKELRPCVLIHSTDASRLKIEDGALVALGNRRGRVRLHVRVSDVASPGTLVSEGIWPNEDFVDGRGINTLTSDESVAPFGGAAFHDIHVWLRPG